MKHSYEISPRPAELGGGWQLRLKVNDIEVGGGVFPLVQTGHQNPTEALQTAFSQALAEALTWVKSRKA